MRKGFEEDYQRLFKELEATKRIHRFELSSWTSRRIDCFNRLVSMVSQRLPIKQAKLLRRHKYILEKLASSGRKDRRKILRNAPAELFQVLNTIFKLINKDQLQLTNHQHQKIKRHKKFIRSASGLKSSHIKRKLDGQSGGALATILSTVLPVISGLIQSVL